jgi:hypothetical protein
MAVEAELKGAEKEHLSTAIASIRKAMEQLK